MSRVDNLYVYSRSNNLTELYKKVNLKEIMKKNGYIFNPKENNYYKGEEKQIEINFNNDKISIVSFNMGLPHKTAYDMCKILDIKDNYLNSISDIGDNFDFGMDLDEINNFCSEYTDNKDYLKDFLNKIYKVSEKYQKEIILDPKDDRLRYKEDDNTSKMFLSDIIKKSKTDNININNLFNYQPVNKEENINKIIKEIKKIEIDTEKKIDYSTPYLDSINKTIANILFKNKKYNFLNFLENHNIIGSIYNIIEKDNNTGEYKLKNDTEIKRVLSDIIDNPPLLIIVNNIIDNDNFPETIVY